MSRAAVALHRAAIRAFCRRWKITELALFGSVLRDDFGPASEVDMPVTFAPDARSNLFDHVAMEEEMAAILGRPVDLVSKGGIERSRSWIRRRVILGAAEPYYVAR